MILIRPARAIDVFWIAPRLRQEDALEVRTATGKDPEQVLPESFILSRECYTAWRVVKGGVAERPCALFGVADDATDPQQGVIWFLGTDEIRLTPVSLLHELKHWLRFMSRHYTALHNVADSRNDLHIRWCRLMGFKTGPDVEINGSPFTYIYRPTDV